MRKKSIPKLSKNVFFHLYIQYIFDAYIRNNWSIIEYGTIFRVKGQYGFIVLNS